ncbi:hypothetical protein FOA43_000382 [Brettanomyces nanus]|uniref:RBR-type E3 ubiquitin transferase n=1 Tax=Eeniella nana TaxID=13502 RepID=A0A875RT21_EENNA|nr:uncharacterized protein FOA43_000382 [Brettanomyces nanus]QPG73077.1 hypothetical protein FOA43_000382 [Brettanomyces nanus]
MSEDFHCGSEPESEEEFNSEYESSEFEYEDEAYLDDDNMEKVEVHYTFQVSKTRMGTPTHRMKYMPVSVEDVQKSLDDKVMQLNQILQIGIDECRILLIEYDWNDDRLLEDFTSRKTEDFYKASGIISDLYAKKDNEDLLEKITDESFECNICYNSPSKKRPLEAFRLQNCNHPFCTNCYIRFIQEANANSQLLIRCPNSECNHVLRISEIEQLSEYDWQRRKKLDDQKQLENKERARVPLTEDQIREKYQKNEQDSDLSDFSDLEIGDPSEVNDSDSKKDSNDNKTIDNVEVEPAKELFNFQERMLLKEREERERRRNSTLLSKYWFNATTMYCSKNYKNFKNCPFPDCDSLVMQLGFDSSTVATLAEYTKRLLIPSVQCSHKHEFCYNCLKEDHSPCPCAIVKKWERKCKDDSETAHWIVANTKDCPKCSSPIEKNGGCNHMVCRSCQHQFCWVCLKDWACHGNMNYNCIMYDEGTQEAKVEQEKNRKSLERYMFYFRLFANQRTSFEKDKKFLEQFESRIQEIQRNSSISWIETLFYRESVDILLRARRELMWSYAIMYYIDSKCPRQLLEGVQCTLSHQVERLSMLFADTEANLNLRQKSKFLNYSSMVKKSRDSLKETYLDCITNGIIKLTRI